MISIDKALNCYYVIYRNLSYGRQNDENKRAIKNAGGITALVRYVHNNVIAMLNKHVLDSAINIFKAPSFTYYLRFFAGS